jgi:class 3 adenylate cyclase/DNA-binding NarL/FixJ family response regulator
MSPERSSVRTVTVLFTDVVGSTQLFSSLGEHGGDRLRTRHFALLRRTIQFHGGREVKSLGDGLMAVFDSATDGVRCAVEMQRAIDEDNRRAHAERIAIRVGLGMGEATVEGGDYFGSPVVEASRLCDQAGPGEILATDMVRVLVGSRGGYAFEALGALELKGLPAAVSTSRVLWEPARQETVRVVVADDAVLLREGVCRLLEEDGIQVVGQAGTAEELLSCVRSARPDVAITDVRMPPTKTLEGIEAAERIRAEHPGVRVLLLSQHLEARYAMRLIAGGAQGIGYLLKERVTDIADFSQMVRRIARGGSAIDAEVIEDLLARRSSAGALASLDDSDRQLLCAVAQGRPDPDVAQLVGLDAAQVPSAVAALFEKLDLPRPGDDHERVETLLHHLAGDLADLREAM